MVLASRCAQFAQAISAEVLLPRSAPLQRQGKQSGSYALALQGSISQSIKWLDREGMKLIEQASRPLSCLPGSILFADCIAHMQADPQRFSQYIVQYSNTICGRHPIGVFLSVSLSLTT